ncbi:MAG TPA: MBL fold metallo-hydrolase [Candidatus Limnocylindrales bacterium]|nr:MBL fold metallo-hydrolase [Candidatus Limnocylindrales bacterium]
MRSVGVRFVGHATTVLDLGGVRVATDPLLRSSLGPLERHGAPPEPDWFDGVEAVLVSHGHPDHFDPPSLARTVGRAAVVVPRGLGRAAAHLTAGAVIEVVAGDRFAVGPVEIEVVPARHWITPGTPRATPVGYLLRAPGSPSVYFAGDTGPFPGLERLTGRVDLALLPVWTWGPHLGPGHLGPRSAAELLARLGAAAAIPIHWGTLYPRRLSRVWDRPLRQPGWRFAGHAATLAPTADVRVLQPGATARIEVADPARPASAVPGARLVR